MDGARLGLPNLYELNIYINPFIKRNVSVSIKKQKKKLAMVSSWLLRCDTQGDNTFVGIPANVVITAAQKQTNKSFFFMLGYVKEHCTHCVAQKNNMQD